MSTLPWRASGSRSWAKGWSVVACLALLSAPVLAQGRSTLALPRLEKTAQGQALGEGAALLEGLNALGANPAGLHVLRPEALAQYQQAPLDTSLALVGLAYPVRRLKTTLALSYLSLRSSGFDRRSGLGEPLGSFSHEERLLGLHASRSFRLSKSPSAARVLLGASLKLLSMGIDGYRAQATVVDIGGRARLGRLPISIGAAALNLGRGPRLLAEESKLPTRAVLSAAWQAGALTLLGGLSHLPYEERRQFSLGAQYSLGSALALRASYSLGGGTPSEVLRNLAGGLGLRLPSGHSLDYAFQPYDEELRRAGAWGAHRLTMTFRL